MTRDIPRRPANKLAFNDWDPSRASTSLSWINCRGTGSRPDSNWIDSFRDSSRVKFPVISLLPSGIQARATGANNSSLSKKIAILLVASPAIRCVRSENVSLPRPSNCILIVHSPVFGEVDGNALSRLSPVSPRSASVNIWQVLSVHVRSLKSSCAVSPMSDLASSLHLLFQGN